MNSQGSCSPLSSRRGRIHLQRRRSGVGDVPGNADRDAIADVVDAFTLDRFEVFIAQVG